MRKFSEVQNINPLVPEVLDTHEVENLIKLGQYDYQGPSFLDNIVYTTWDGEEHYGVLVTSKNYHDNSSEAYFMERTWETVEDRGDHWLCQPIYHKLLPVVLERSDNIHPFGSVQYLVAEVIRKCYFDNIRIDGDVKGLTFADVTGCVAMEKSDEEIQTYNNQREQLVELLLTETVEAGDEKWDDLLFGKKEDMYKVFHGLRAQGHNIHLDGEKDSFGWVTCGIVMDGELMTSQYF